MIPVATVMAASSVACSIAIAASAAAATRVAPSRHVPLLWKRAAALPSRPAAQPACRHAALFVACSVGIATAIAVAATIARGCADRSVPLRLKPLLRPEPTCCAPARRHCGLFSGLFHRHRHGGCCDTGCDVGCAAEPTCCGH